MIISSILIEKFQRKVIFVRRLNGIVVLEQFEPVAFMFLLGVCFDIFLAPSFKVFIKVRIRNLEISAETEHKNE